MSRIGPQLPPHLINRNTPASDSEGSDDDYGPKLPNKPCRGPLPDSAPNLGREELKSEGESSDDDYGPVLPPHLQQSCKTDASTVIAPQENNSNDDSDSDGEMIGPRMVESTGKLSREDIVKEFESRSLKMKDKLEGKDVKEVQRESWMLELPEEKANSFGLGARTFSRKGVPEKGKDRSIWTDSPADKERKLREGGAVSNESEEPPTVNYRDIEMAKVSQELKKKRGSESLMEMHDKKIQKKKKEDIANGMKEERRPFDRETDLQVNRFDDAVKKNMLKAAAKMNDRFSSGNQKFL